MGDDTITGGSNWDSSFIIGNEGNDVITFGSGNALAKVNAGHGDDTVNGPQDPATGNDVEFLSAGEGNDKINGGDKAGVQTIIGDQGDD